MRKGATMPPKKKIGKTKKVKELPLPEAPVVEKDDEDMSEDEVDNIIAKAEEKKVEAVKKVELSVDKQEWTKQDPVIPEELEERVWVAVYRCPNGHKTKATNRQKDSGVQCYECKETAVIVPQFLNKPTNQEDKRKKS